ncbi:DUF2779 domain-containing protein [Candidatus Nomurabacteria bacterium]|nr:DUF2779 domain-containing protein [Candidatus Nomurabacteria bacterium]
MKKIRLTKTDFIIYKECAKNAWLKVHRPEIYRKKPLSTFDLGIIETGNEVDRIARDLFPGGALISNRKANDETKKLIEKHEKVIYQPVFMTEKYEAISDILVWNEKRKVYDLYEVKSSTNGDGKGAKEKVYIDDIAFQYLVMKENNVPLGKLSLIRLNGKYVRGAELEIEKLFAIDDFTEEVVDVSEIIAEEMKTAYGFISQEKEPAGHCVCVTKGRGNHCTTFWHSNSQMPKDHQVPEYSVHDISRIGQGKGKLAELVDRRIYDIRDVPDDFPLSEKQKNQVDAVKSGRVDIKHEEIEEFINKLKYPIAFFDYETYACAIPRFQGYHPFDQIPFQFSLHVLEEDGKLTHFEYICKENKNPDEEIINAIQKSMPASGSIVTWHKSFEMGRNRELGERNPKFKKYFTGLNDRIETADLEEIFLNQQYIHPKFKGKTSVKYVLPALTNISYQDLEIKEGATASDTWNKIVNKEFDKTETDEKISHLLEYCKQDTFAMYRIWKHLKEEI